MPTLSKNFYDKMIKYKRYCVCKGGQKLKKLETREMSISDEIRQPKGFASTISFPKS